MDCGPLRNDYEQMDRFAQAFCRKPLEKKGMWSISSPLLNQLSYLPGLEPAGPGGDAKASMEPLHLA
jgi:hypothetical protein